MGPASACLSSVETCQWTALSKPMDSPINTFDGAYLSFFSRVSIVYSSISR